MRETHMARVEIRAQDETGHIGIEAHLRRAEQADIARALALRIGAHSVGAAEVHLLRAIEVAARDLPRGLDEHICAMAEAAHGRAVDGELRIRPRRMRHLVPIAGELAAQRQMARRERRVIGERRLRQLPCALDADMGARGVLLAVRVALVLVDIIFQAAIVQSVVELERRVMQMVERIAAEEAHGIRLAVRAPVAHRAAELVVHLADAEAERRAAASDGHLIVHVVVVHMAVGNERAEPEPPARAADIVEGMLQAVTVAPRGLRAVVLRVEHGIRRLAVLDAHRHIARAERLARREHADGARAGDI